MFYGEFINEVKDLQERTEQIYIYGAGFARKGIMSYFNKK